MDQFTPFTSLLGGALIGLASAVLLAFHGRIAGISGILGGLLAPARGESGWRAAFLAGLVGGGTVLGLLRPDLFASDFVAAPAVTVAAGLLVGLGTRLGGGCTSGHGVCGISRLSTRSLIATVLFMTAGIATVTFTHHLLG